MLINSSYTALCRVINYTVGKAIVLSTDVPLVLGLGPLPETGFPG